MTGQNLHKNEQSTHLIKAWSRVDPVHLTTSTAMKSTTGYFINFSLSTLRELKICALTKMSKVSILVGMSADNVLIAQTNLLLSLI